MGNVIKNAIKKYGKDRTNLIEMLREIQKQERFISEKAIDIISKELKMSRVEVEGPATFYHFLSKSNRGKTTIYLNKSATSEMYGYDEVKDAFEKELGTSIESNSDNNDFGFYSTSCIGMCDQEPAALIEDVVFTNLTADKVKNIISKLKSGTAAQDIYTDYGDGKNQEIKATVNNNIIVKGPVFFAPHQSGEGLKKALELSGDDIIHEVKESNLRGRGGAGFPTGMKWQFCKGAKDPVKYIFCNIDEGEPGTFKDRVLLTECPELIFEGMAISGYTLGAKEGFAYLRAEYHYLKEHLENVLELMRKKNLLGKNILGKKFDFDIKIKMGAGAYICGEESALIESAEGKRGEPRNRPPFPVQVGYLGKPTVVNNPETYSCVARIMDRGAKWFFALGSKDSSGVKLLSISGDCPKPGIYEIEFGKTVQEILDMAGASNVQAVQVGGPSGTLINKSQFNRKISFTDLATGGAFCIIGEKRNLLKVIYNYMEFFVEESCGFCVPCRAGNVLLMKTLEKILVGNGTSKDLEDLESWGKMIKTASRCGLGQTSPNPILTSLENFKELFTSKVRMDIDYKSQFDLKYAVEESCKVAGRIPNINEGH